MSKEAYVHLENRKQIQYFHCTSVVFLFVIFGLCACSTPAPRSVNDPLAVHSALGASSEPSAPGVPGVPGVLSPIFTPLSWDLIAKDFQVSTEEMEVLGKLFVEALSHGPRSMHYQALCGPIPERCQSLDQFFTFMDELNEGRREGRRERKKMNRRFSLSVNAVLKNQSQDIRRLLGGLYLRSEKEFYNLANKALEAKSEEESKACPKNLSAVLSVRAAKFFPAKEAHDFSEKLFDQAEHCLTKEDESWEGLFLRQGLYALAMGNISRAERLLLQSMNGSTKNEEYRSLYWLGKISDQKGIKIKDNSYWQDMIRKYPLSYYAIKVQTAFGNDPLEMIPDRSVEFLRFSKVRPEVNSRLRWLEVLVLRGDRERVKRWMEWIAIDSRNLEPDLIHYLSALMLQEEYFRSNISMLMRYYKFHPDRVDRFGLRSMYPRPYFDDINEVAKDKVQTHLLLGLIRQESAFDPRAVSSARAKGLMQIIPKTARRLLRNGDKKLFDEKHNVDMGIKYLARLGDRFFGEVELALAAYNAGPNRVDEWLERFPDRKDPLLWNDLIPFQETRDYVTSILRNNYWYERLYPSEKVGDRVLASKLIEELTINSTN